jgi:hypothetical protein
MDVAFNENDLLLEIQKRNDIIMQQRNSIVQLEEALLFYKQTVSLVIYDLVFII